MSLKKSGRLEQMNFQYYQKRLYKVSAKEIITSEKLVIIKKMPSAFL